MDESVPRPKIDFKKWMPSPLTLILLGLIAYLWFRPPADVSEDNRPVPPWQVTLPDGRLLSSESLCPQGVGRGCKDAKASTTTLKGRVVLVNFWATWCPYCRKEKPVIDAYWKDNQARGFEVIAISIDDSPEKIAAWAKKTGYTFMAAPTNASVSEAFGTVNSVPTSFILDRDGHIRHKIAGQLHSARLKKLVEPLLASPAPLSLNPAVFLPSPASGGGVGGEGLSASDIPRRVQSPSPQPSPAYGRGGYP